MSIKVRERDVESYLVQKLESAGFPCHKFHPDGKAGMPDRVVLLPGSRVVWIETKTTGGHLEEIQKLQHKRLRDIGHKVFVIWNKDDADRVVDEITKEKYSSSDL